MGENFIILNKPKLIDIKNLTTIMNDSIQSNSKFDIKNIMEFENQRWVNSQMIQNIENKDFDTGDDIKIVNNELKIAFFNYKNDVPSNSFILDFSSYTNFYNRIHSVVQNSYRKTEKFHKENFSEYNAKNVEESVLKENYHHLNFLVTKFYLNNLVGLVNLPLLFCENKLIDFNVKDVE